jgi:tetratricopeptide (TPR) repeat protein
MDGSMGGWPPEPASRAFLPAVHSAQRFRGEPVFQMMRNSRFWAFMAVFQLLFGLSVFAMTRQYYLGQPEQTVTPAAAAEQPAQPVRNETPANPHADLRNDPTGDLAELMSSFPGQAQDPVALARQGDRFFAEQRYDLAAQQYRLAVEAGSRDANDYNSLGLTLHYLGRSAEALQILNEGIALDSSYQRIWLTLGYVNSQLGNTEQAREALGTAVRMDADNEIGRSAAAMLEQLP